MRQALGLDADSNEQLIFDKIKSILDISKNSVDPAAYVPIELFQNTVNELNRVHSGISRDAAEREVSKAIDEMRLFPFMREWAIELCTVNKRAFDSFINNVSKNISILDTMSKGSSLQGYNPNSSKQSQKSVDKMIATNLGLSDSDLEKFGS